MTADVFVCVRRYVAGIFKPSAFGVALSELVYHPGPMANSVPLPPRSPATTLAPKPMAVPKEVGRDVAFKPMSFCGVAHFDDFQQLCEGVDDSGCTGPLPCPDQH